MTQVNQNFTDLINGLSDGTKDLSINAITCAGNATFNGNTAIGNAAGDTLTITASLSSTIPIGTTFSYDFGSTTIGLRDLYFGSIDSAARTTKIRAGTVASSNTLTLPIITGTVRLYSDPVITIKSSGSGTFTCSANVKYIRIKMIGGGGGGACSGTTSGTPGSNGVDTTFSIHSGAAILTAGGGKIPAHSSTAAGGAGGTPVTAVGTTGTTVLIAMNGNDGGGAWTENLNTDVSFSGGVGGPGPWGGSGLAAIATGGAAVANSGAGGAGGGLSALTNGVVGGGGGAGAYIEAIVAGANLAASYDYSVGAKGNGQGLGTSGAAGGDGGSGIIIFEEHFG